MKRLLFALSAISLMIVATGCCCGSQCCGYGGGCNTCGPCGGGCPNGACGVGGPVYQGAVLPGTAVQAAVPVQNTSAVATAPATFTTAQYSATAMVEPLPTY